MELIQLIQIILGVALVLIVPVFGIIRYAVKTAVNNELSKGLEQYKSTLEKNNSILFSTLSVYKEASIAVQKRRLEAIEKIWALCVKTGENNSGYYFFLDILLPNEYNDASQKKFKDLFYDKAEQTLDSNVNRVEFDIEIIFLTEKLSKLFWALQAFQGRVAIKLVMDFRKGNGLKSWKEDEFAFQILEGVLSQEEIKQIKEDKSTQVSPVINFLKFKIRDEVNYELSGEKIANANLGYAKRMSNLEAKLKKKI